MLNGDHISYQGWFDKIGAKVKSWKRRLFVIAGYKMYYFKDQTMTDALGVIPLIDTTVTNEPVTDDPGFYFMLRFPPATSNGRSEYLFRTQKEEERTTWANEIMKANKITVFNRILQQGCRVNPKDFGLHIPIPYFLPQAFQYLEENAMDIEGIYRLNGSGSAIEALQTKIDLNEHVTFSDPHVTTGLIKLYLRNLPEPLLLIENYNSLKSVLKAKEEKQATQLAKILRTLPICNYILVYYIFTHFIKLLKHEEKTKMGKQNLCVCIGPSLCRSSEETASGAYDESNVQQQICGILLSSFDTIFGQNPLAEYRGNGSSQFFRLQRSQDSTALFTLKAPAGSVVQAVAEDRFGWTICVFDGEWGVVHRDSLSEELPLRDLLHGLGNQTKKWALPDNVLSAMSTQCPEALSLYMALTEKLKELRNNAVSI